MLTLHPSTKIMRGLLVSYPLSVSCMKNRYTPKFISTLTSTYLISCGFRKGFNSQYTLISLLETLKRSLDCQGIGAALLTDLSKASDCLNHNLTIAKLHAYGFDESSLKFISSYVVGRNQRTRIGNSYSSWTDIVSGVSQGSILRPLLFNIYINDLFLFVHKCDIANYADGNTPFSCGKKIDEVISQLEGNVC